MAAAPDYTPQEAAALAGVRLQTLQNALTERRLGRTFQLRKGRRRVDLPALLTFALLDRLRSVRVEPSALYKAFSEAGGLPTAPMVMDEAVTIDALRLLAPVARNMRLYEGVRDRVVSDPAIMGGEPVVRGTRLPARMLHARIKGGDTIDSILGDYPYLDREAVETAVLYIEANPTRGRPRVRRMADKAEEE